MEISSTHTSVRHQHKICTVYLGQGSKRGASLVGGAASMGRAGRILPLSRQSGWF